MKKILVIMLATFLLCGLAIAANAAVGTVVYATKVEKAPGSAETVANW